jgi:hypothetical protein
MSVSAQSSQLHHEFIEVLNAVKVMSHTKQCERRGLVLAIKFTKPGVNL